MSKCDFYSICNSVDVQIPYLLEGYKSVYIMSTTLPIIILASIYHIIFKVNLHVMNRGYSE